MCKPKPINISMCVCVCVHVHVLSHVQLFVPQWTIACWAPLSMDVSREKY